MSKPRDDVEVGIYDPSYRVQGRYWQWANVKIDENWNDAARQVHTGWPEKIGDFNDQQQVLYGVITSEMDALWLYRVFPGGRDNFGRRGRYFFVLFKLRSPEQITNLQVSDLIHYFERERSLPLKIAPLDVGVASTGPVALLQKLFEHQRTGRKSSHWGMDESGEVIEFTKPAMPTQPPTRLMAIERAHQDHTKQRGGINPGWVIMLVTAVILAGYGMLYCYNLGYDKGYKIGSDEGLPNKGANQSSGENDRQKPSLADDKNVRVRPDESPIPKVKKRS